MDNQSGLSPRSMCILWCHFSHRALHLSNYSQVFKDIRILHVPFKSFAGFRFFSVSSLFAKQSAKFKTPDVSKLFSAKSPYRYLYMRFWYKIYCQSVWVFCYECYLLNKKVEKNRLKWKNKSSNELQGVYSHASEIVIIRKETDICYEFSDVIYNVWQALDQPEKKILKMGLRFNFIFVFG